MRFIDVQVEEHEALPDGCSQRFRAQGEGQPILSVSWESDDGLEGVWHVSGRDASDRPVPAIAYEVDDSSAGTSILIVGGSHGLRLRLADTEVAEPYLLVSRQALSREHRVGEAGRREEEDF
jgi:hypothetical protein